ncbi:MAG: hypothetical protein H0X37_21500 [Herpetosiphonaceae bacterium]|nr:hypothetical protein [Herpetosiphonaceae bacterium]
MNSAAIPFLVVVVLCTLILYGSYRAFDSLQTRAEQGRGLRRWTAIALAGVVAVIALLTFWLCFSFSAGLLQALGLNLK